MKWYPWLNGIYRQILTSYQNNIGHHVLLIKSNRNNGEDSLIYALNRWLLCSQPVGIKSCNQCRNCYLMQSKYHPDYYELQSENKTQSIGVDVVRALIDKLYNYACIAKFKIVYIKHTEHLTEESVNALLKIFEDPPDHVYFFLKCKGFKFLLSTLVSRCVCWIISPPSENFGLSWLRAQGITDNMQAITALRLSDRSPLEAFTILKSHYWLLRLKLCQLLKSSIEDNNFLRIFPILEKYSNQDSLLILWLMSLLIDSLKWHSGIQNFLVNMDQKDLICFIASKLSVLDLNNQLQQWLVYIYYWNNIDNINHKLLLYYQLLNCEGNVINFRYQL